MDKPSIPTLAFGERFKVTSRSGKQYVVRFLHRGRGDSGVFVRTDRGHVARFDSRKVEWKSYEPASGSVGKAILKTGDEVLVDCNVGSLRGKLISELGDEEIRLENGLTLNSSEVHAVHLLFRAPAIMGGDRFWVRGKDGVVYNGDALDVGPVSVRFRLTNGSIVELGVDDLDYRTLLVAIPIPRYVWGAADSEPPPEDPS